MNKIIDISKLIESNIPKKKKKQPGKKSKNTAPERKVQNILKELKIKFTTQHEVAGKFYDIYIPSKNVLIEVDGDYWHGKDIDYLNKNKVQKKAFANDLNKDGLATLHGYTLYRVWESEITKEKIKKMLYE